jgi:hypothetical protein
MADWTAQISTEASPEQLLEVLTHPEEIRRWSPVDFDLEDLTSSRLTAGTRTRVTGKLAGVSMGFDVEVRAADEAGLELTADGPIGIDVRYDLAPGELNAFVSVRRGGGLTGRLVANATSALLSAGALDGATSRIARAAESAPDYALAA